jgi:hypothetical protein
MFITILPPPHVARSALAREDNVGGLDCNRQKPSRVYSFQEASIGLQDEQPRGLMAVDVKVPIPFLIGDAEHLYDMSLGVLT